MNKQEIFDKVVTHLLTQNKVAMTEYEASCAYRGANGTKCAVGCLIADEHYTEKLEGRAIGHEDVQQALKASGIDTDEDEIYFLLSDLQSMHDFTDPEEWASTLSECAAYRGLQFNPPVTA